MNTPLVSVQWLAEHLHDENVIVLDASMEQVVGKEPIHYDEFLCIPGAIKFDLEKVFYDCESSQTHAMPTAEQFKRAAENLGLSAHKQLVVYDNQGIYSSPRAWWMLRSMGLSQVSVLDGGLPEWIKSGYDTSSGYAASQTSELNVQLDQRGVCDFNYVLSILESEQHQILDARGRARFHAEVPEPRPGVRGGHMPGAINLPFIEVLAGNCMKSADELRKLFAENDIKVKNRIVCSCGSGITACILLLALEVSGYSKKVLYDGSWAEWGANPELPLVTN